MGKKLLQEGNLPEALKHYNMAVCMFTIIIILLLLLLLFMSTNSIFMCIRAIIFLLVSFTAGDPSNYLTYFKRATVYLALGQSKKALPDLAKVVELKPDFHQVTTNECSSLFANDVCFV